MLHTKLLKIIKRISSFRWALFLLPPSSFVEWARGQQFRGNNFMLNRIYISFVEWAHGLKSIYWIKPTFCGSRAIGICHRVIYRVRMLLVLCRTSSKWATYHWHLYLSYMSRPPLPSHSSSSHSFCYRHPGLQLLYPSIFTWHHMRKMIFLKRKAWSAVNKLL